MAREVLPLARRFHRSAPRAALAAALCLLLSPAGDAAARKFQMSGTWIVRTGRLFIPLQFATHVIDKTGNVIHASMGNLTAALGPNGPILGGGGLTATGSAPSTLRVPAHRFVQDAMALEAPYGAYQVTTNFGVDAPYAAATLAPGGGPGSFTWCPGDPACLAGGGMRSTDQPYGAGSRNGRVIYRAGPNRFGGAMQLGLRRGGTLSSLFALSPVRVLHRPAYWPAWGSGTALRRVAVGGLGSADAPSTQMIFLKRAFVTQPTMAPPPYFPILYPGPKLTTMLGTTLAGTGPVYYLPKIATGPMGTLAGQFSTRYGFANTTGTVIAQQTTGTSFGQGFFTVMGSDARTPLGAGNLSLVAGGLGFRNTYSGADVSASFQKVTLTLAAAIPSLSPPGVAAAAALVLLAAGWALRGRLG